MKRSVLAAVLAVTVAGALAACGADPAGGSAAGAGKPVTVLAAASLTESFTRIGKDFTAAHPGSTVTFSFLGSSALAQQIVSGARADVFAAASPATMKTVTDAGDAAGAPA